jgi:hypothetical protein
MRRASSLLATAAILISAIVGITYAIRRSQAEHAKHEKPPSLKVSEDGLALQGWKYNKDDPKTNRPVVRLYAASMRATNNPSAFELRGVALKMFNKKDASYTYIKADKASFGERSEVLVSEGPVTIVMNVPVDKDAEDKDELAKRVQVHTSVTVGEG